MKRHFFAAYLVASTIPIDSAWARLGGNTSSDGIPWLRMILGLALCLGLALAAALVLRSRGGVSIVPAWRTRTRRLQLLETVRTGPQTSLSLVRVDHTEYLLVSAPGGAQLAEYQSADHPDDGASA